MIEWVKRLFCAHVFEFLNSVKQYFDGHAAGANHYYMCKKCGKVRMVKLR